MGENLHPAEGFGAGGEHSRRVTALPLQPVRKCPLWVLAFWPCLDLHPGAAGMGGQAAGAVVGASWSRQSTELR